MNEFECVLTKRTTPQPKPKLYKGGDCGACVISGLLGLSVPEVYERLGGGKVQPFSRDTAYSAFAEAESQNLCKWYIDDVPYWPPYEGHRSFGDPSWWQEKGWFSWVSMAMMSGHYGYASINFEGDGPIKDTNHAIMLCGVRAYWKPIKTVAGARSLVKEVMVSCSAKCPDGYWINVSEFLTKHGGFNPIWVLI